MLTINTGSSNSVRKLYLKAYRLYLEGYTYREIAKRLYGDDSAKAINRVKNILAYARSKSFNPVVNNSLSLIPVDNVIAYKKKAKGFTRQYVTHEQLIYHIMDGRRNFRVFLTAKLLHSQLFTLFYNNYELRAWRNGKRKPFSYTKHSLGYALGVAQAAWMLHGVAPFNNLRLPEPDHMLDPEVAQVAGTVLSRVYALRLVGASIGLHEEALS